MAAVLLTAAGYGCLTLYDALGLRFAGARVPYHRLALISFMGYAIGHNVGLNTLSGGAVRYRAYSALGLSAKQIATVIAFGTLTFILGAAALLGISLLSQAATVRLGAAFASRADRARRMRAARRRRRLSHAVVSPSRAAAVAQYRDPRSETAHRMRSDRRRLRGSAVCRRGVVRAASGAGRDRLCGLCGRVSHCHRRGHHQQRAGRRGRVRVGVPAAVSGSAGGSSARLAARLPPHLLPRSLCRGADPARRA